MFKQPKFDERDLAEIFYAVEWKLQSVTLAGGDLVARKWRTHLRSIMKKILDSEANI